MKPRISPILFALGLTCSSAFAALPSDLLGASRPLSKGVIAAATQAAVAQGMPTKLTVVAVW